MRTTRNRDAENVCLIYCRIFYTGRSAFDITLFTVKIERFFLRIYVLRVVSYSPQQLGRDEPFFFQLADNENIL